MLKNSWLVALPQSSRFSSLSINLEHDFYNVQNGFVGDTR